MRSDDIAPLLAAPQGDPTAIRGGQGVVVAWNPLTAENVIRFRGTDLVNLPTHATSTEVLQIKPGDSVVLHIWGSGATATIYVVGRITTPGTPQAGSFMDLFGFQTAYEATEAECLGDFVDLQAPANPGPAVTVNVGIKGRVLVIIQSEIVSFRTNDGFKGGTVAVQVSGANVEAPTRRNALRWVWWSEITVSAFESNSGAAARVYTGLNPGLTTFTMKYSRVDSGVTVKMKDRSIMALPY